MRVFRETNSEGAFALLVERYGRMMRHEARRILKDAHDAEDIAQTVFLLLAQQAHQSRSACDVALMSRPCRTALGVGRTGDRPGPSYRSQADRGSVRSPARRAVRHGRGRVVRKA